MRWLITLFAAREEAEAILGDLHEEHSQIARSLGPARARTWYARQVIRTVLGAWVLRRRAMSTALSAFFALTLLVFVIDPLVLSFFMPRRMLPPGFILARALVALGSWGLTMLAGTALGIKLRQKMQIA